METLFLGEKYFLAVADEGRFWAKLIALVHRYSAHFTSPLTFVYFIRYVANCCKQVSPISANNVADCGSKWVVYFLSTLTLRFVLLKRKEQMAIHSFLYECYTLAIIKLLKVYQCLCWCLPTINYLLLISETLSLHVWFFSDISPLDMAYPCYWSSFHSLSMLSASTGKPTGDTSTSHNITYGPYHKW